MKIILAGYIALEATHKLIENEKPALRCRFSNRFLDITDEMTFTQMVSRDSIIEVMQSEGASIQDSEIDGLSNVIELSDMGIFGSLWDYAEQTGTGLTINLESISIRQETIEIFECLDVNPYTYPSKGSFLIRSDRAYDIADALVKNNIPAAVIGKETSVKDRVVINQDETRFLTPVDRLLKDEQGMRDLRYIK